MLGILLQNTRSQALLLILVGEDSFVMLDGGRNIGVVRAFTILHSVAELAVFCFACLRF